MKPSAVCLRIPLNYPILMHTVDKKKSMACAPWSQGVIMNKVGNEKPEKPGEPEQGSALLNIGKIIFLIATLVAAWFILEKLMGK
jgi:hypothetical protein